MARRLFSVSLLKTLRTQFNLTQSELGQRIGVTKAAVSAYELGKAQPSAPVLAALSREFDLSIDLLPNNLAGAAGSTLPLHSFRSVPLLLEANQSAFAYSLGAGAAPYSLAECLDVPGLPLTSEFENPLVVEVAGDMMAPTLRAGSRLVATPVPPPEWPYMPCGVYCVVYRATFVIKRVQDNHLAERQQLLLHADNPLGGTHLVRAEDIRAIWLVRWAIYAPVS